MNCLVPLLLISVGFMKPQVLACKITKETMHSWVEIKVVGDNFSRRITYNHFFDKHCNIVKTNRYVDDLKGKPSLLDRASLKWYQPEAFLADFMVTQCKAL